MKRLKNKFFNFLFFVFIFSSTFVLKLFPQEVEFGVHWWNAYQLSNSDVFGAEKNIAKEAGIKWIRATFDWSDIQPSQNSFDESYISIMQNNIDLLKRDGFKVIAMLLWTPKWASSYPYSDIDSAKHWAPSDTLVWLNFLDTIVKRFKDKVEYWEIWNEQDGGYFNTSLGVFQSKSRAYAYSLFLKSGYRKIKSIDASAKVLFGGLTSEVAINSLKRDFMDSLFIKYNAAEYIDIMNIHVYVNAKSLIDTLNDRWDKYKLNGKAFWITETSNFRAYNSGYLSESQSASFFSDWLKDSVVAKFRHFNQNNNYNLPFVVVWFPLQNKYEGYPPYPMAWGLLDSTGKKTQLFNEYKNSISIITGVDKQKAVPDEFVLYQNYPNPFNPSTNIKYTLPASGDVTLSIYDILGRKIKYLVSEYQPSGVYSVVWRASKFPSGVYVYVLSVNNKLVGRKKMLFIK